MIDLVLEEAGVPALRFNLHRLSSLVERAHSDPQRTRHDGHKARQAQAAFEEVDFRRRQKFELGVD